MQADIWQTVQAWLLTLLLYPGALFAVLMVLVGEWLASTLRPLFSPRLFRGQARLYSFLQPLYTFLKLLGRQGAVRWQRPDDSPTASSHPGETLLAVVGAIAPLLVLALLPVGGTRIGQIRGPVGDLPTVLLLLAVQPVTRAVLRLREGGMEALAGARDLGRLRVGLLPTLVAVATLVQVSGSNTTRLADLTAAPLTAQQTLVRVLAGGVLVVALPWLTGWRTGKGGEEGSAGMYAGRFLQTVAVAAFWAVIVLPAPGEMPWAVAFFVVGTLFAYVTIKSLAQGWAPARREGEAANLLWAATLPLSAIALVLAFWTGT